MLTMVEVINPRGQNIELPLTNYGAGYLVKDVEGLDPVKATMSTSTATGLDGELYDASRLEPRNIILHLDFMPDYVLTSVKDLRTRLYSFLMPGLPVTLKFYFDDVYTAYATGRVETFEAPLFSKEPGADISIMCFNPAFIAAESKIFTANSTDGYIGQELNYEGSIGAGFVFTLFANHSIDHFSLVNEAPDGQWYEFNWYNSVPALTDGDTLTLSTVPGDKWVETNRGGVTQSDMAFVTTNAMWFGLQPGLNYISCWIDETPVPYQLEYTPKYGGF